MHIATTDEQAEVHREQSSGTLSSVSSSPIAAVGLALAVYLYEAHRMTSFQTTAPESFSNSVLVAIATIATLLTLALAVKRSGTFRLHRHTAVCFTIASVFSIALLWTFGAIELPLETHWDTAATLIMRICEILTLACWGEVLLMLMARQAATVVAVSLIVLGFINALSAFIRPESAGIMVALFPFLSIACLQWLKDRAVAMNDTFCLDGPSSTVYQFDRSLIPARHPHGHVITVLNFMLPLLCCPMVFGYIHYAWIPAQDGGFASTMIQLSAAIGTVLGGALLWALVSGFWGRRKLTLYNLFTLLLLTLTFSLVGLVNNTFPYPYIVMLNIAQKIAFFFVWVTPFLVRTNMSQVTVLLVSLGLYQIGKTVAKIGYISLDSNAYLLLTLAFLVVLIVGNVTGIVLDQGERDWGAGLDAAGKKAGVGDLAVYVYMTTEPETPEPARKAADKQAADRGNGTGQPHDGDASVSTDDDQLERACATLAKQYHLSRREEDVLRLLAQGMVAREIAETLVISNSTAKTHMRNLYAKMDVHSQTELVLMISQVR